MTTRSLLTVIFAVALAAVGAVWIKSLVPPDSPSGSLQFLSAAAELPIFDKAGAKTDLAKEKGKIFIIHFWATWCPPCVEDLPTLERLYRAYLGKDLEILAVSVDEGGAGAVVPFMQKNRFALPILLNPDQSVSRSYGSFKFPETYLVDREGVVRKKVIGAVDWMSPAAQQVIQAMLEKK